MIPRPEKTGGKGAGPFSTDIVDKTLQILQPLPAVDDTPALEVDTSRDNVVVDLESAHCDPYTVYGYKRSYGSDRGRSDPHDFIT